MDERIRFGEPFEPPLPEEKPPPAYLLIPSRENRVRQTESFRVYIVETALDQIRQHVREDVRIESGGVLVGHPFRDFDDPTITFIVIVAAIRQDSNDRSVGHFTVSPREIAVARAEMEHKYPGLIPVGWYHSHPSHGLFLSSQDMAIMRSIYNASWNVALVVDPRPGKEAFAFFSGPEGEELPRWLMLRKEPVSVTAIGQYNRAQEMLAQGQWKQTRSELIKLTRMVNGSEDMAHWRERGGYRDTQELLDHLSADSSDDYPKGSSQVYFAPDISSDTWYDGPDDLGIPELYDEARQVLRNAMRQRPPDPAKVREALGLFNWIYEKEPDFEDVDILVELVGTLEEQQRSGRRRQVAGSLLQKLLDLL
jgi:proteasome lid subunit RPN8/RPN11